MAYSATVVADSVSPQGVRLTTMVVTFPRIVLAEFNTHRMLSRNSANSRAIPVQRQLDMITADPFIPTHWGRNQRGMQAHATLGEAERTTARIEWQIALRGAIASVNRLQLLNVHKQTTNRLLEPFMWHTVVVTATEWNNFFALRANPDAQPEIREAAERMRDAYQNSMPTVLMDGQWHLPLLQDDERDGAFEHTLEARQVSAARCARVSYLTHDGQRDREADLALYNRLVGGGHMSPLEHVATPFTDAEISVRRAMAEQARGLGTPPGLDPLTLRQLIQSTEFNGNFRGWTQLRKTLEGEDNFALMREE